MLVVGGGLFVQSFARLASVRLGFDPDPDPHCEHQRESQPRDRPRTGRRCTSGFASPCWTVPGVTSAAASVITPITNSSWDTLIENLPGTVAAENGARRLR